MARFAALFAIILLALFAFDGEALALGNMVYSSRTGRRSPASRPV